MIKTKSVDLSLPPSSSSDSSSITNGSYADLPSFFVSEIPRYRGAYQSGSSSYNRSQLAAKPLRSIEPKTLREHLSKSHNNFHSKQSNPRYPEHLQSTRVNASDHRNSNQLSNTVITHQSNFIPKSSLFNTGLNVQASLNAQQGNPDLKLYE